MNELKDFINAAFANCSNLTSLISILHNKCEEICIDILQHKKEGHFAPLLCVFAIGERRGIFFK